MTNINDTLTERGSKYGSFADNGRLAQELKQVLHQQPGWDRLSPIMQEALDLTCMKWSRIINGDPFYADNWHDSSGYMTLVYDWLQDRFKEVPEPKTMHIAEPEPLDDDPELPADLEQFLEENGCLDEYLVESGGVVPYFPHDYIHGAFCWTQTPSGSDFWMIINRRWEEHLKSRKLMEGAQ